MTSQEAPRRSLFAGTTAHDLDAEEALQKLRRADKLLARLIEEVGPFRLQLQAMHSPFASLAESIIYQQLSGKAAATILSRFLLQFPAAGSPPSFPPPADLLAAADEVFRGAGVSRGKMAALRDLAAKTLDGTVPHMEDLSCMGEEEIIERLTAIRGVGRWTAEMLLIFRLGRPDVLPTTDYGIRKGFARTFGCKELPPPQEIARRGERWKPFRSVASWYLWRAMELPGTGEEKKAGRKPRAAE